VHGPAKRDPTPAQERSKLVSFEVFAAPHMGAAYNLARWLTRNNHDAEAVVQEAYLRAHRFYDTYRGGDFRAWLLTLVRNTCYTRLRQNRKPSAILDEDMAELDSAQSNPEALLPRNIDANLLRQAIEELPLDFREAIVLRELEGLSYIGIAAIAGVPLGTVMSRLARARDCLQSKLAGEVRKGVLA
jgi:RNA polymerase sigma-70 factor (ECF subfamily)